MSVIRLFNAQQANGALRTLWTELKPLLLAGHRYLLTVAEETRSGAQNNLLHALLGQIAERIEWAGKRRDPETWKRLLTAAWLRARGESVEVLPAIDGHGIDVVFRRTSKLTRAECTELIDFIDAWAAQQGIALQRPEYAE